LKEKRNGDDFREIAQFIFNIRLHQFVFFDETRQKIDSDVLTKKLIDDFKMLIPAKFYVQRKNVLMEVLISNTSGNEVIIIPQKPYCIKKGFFPDKEGIDLAVYMEVALGFCDNFAISQLLTEFIPSNSE